MTGKRLSPLVPKNTPELPDSPGTRKLCSLNHSLMAGGRGDGGRNDPVTSDSLSFPDPERWTNIPLLVKILKLIINELSTVMEANAARQAAPAEWGQGAGPSPRGRGRQPTLAGPRALAGLRVPVVSKALACGAHVPGTQLCRPRLRRASGCSARGRPGRPRCGNPRGVGPGLSGGASAHPPSCFSSLHRRLQRHVGGPGGGRGGGGGRARRPALVRHPRHEQIR